MKIRAEISAGGVVFRAIGDGFDIAIVHTHENRWQLPKGWIEDGELPEHAAVREVREEAGIDAEIVAPLGTIEYWYRSTYDPEPARVHKIVHAFLLRYLGGSTDDHDGEVTEARWVTIDEALLMLAHKDERDMVARARDLLGEAITSQPDP